MAYRARRSSIHARRLSLAGMRAGAVAVLGLIVVAGTAVAGMEKALAPSGPQHPPVAAPVQPAATLRSPVAAVGPPASDPADAPAPHGRRALPPCAPPVRVCVRLSRSSAWLLTATGAVVGPVPVRHGRPDSPTPVGMFPVQAKNADHVNSVTGAPMPYTMFFAGDLALYQADLSQPSAGSIRLPAEQAQRFFREVSVGDLIQVVP